MAETTRTCDSFSRATVHEAQIGFMQSSEGWSKISQKFVQILQIRARSAVFLRPHAYRQQHCVWCALRDFNCGSLCPCASHSFSFCSRFLELAALPPPPSPESPVLLFGIDFGICRPIVPLSLSHMHWNSDTQTDRRETRHSDNFPRKSRCPSFQRSANIWRT